jgi:hypothetical protein
MDDQYDARASLIASCARCEAVNAEWSVDHGSVTQDRQIEAVAIERDELRFQLADTIDEGLNYALGARRSRPANG